MIGCQIFPNTPMEETFRTHTHTREAPNKMEEGQWEVHGVKTSATSSLSGLEQQKKIIFEPLSVFPRQPTLTLTGGHHRPFDKGVKAPQDERGKCSQGREGVGRAPSASGSLHTPARGSFTFTLRGVWPHTWAQTRRDVNQTNCK